MKIRNFRFLFVPSKYIFWLQQLSQPLKICPTHVSSDRQRFWRNKINQFVKKNKFFFEFNCSADLISTTLFKFVQSINFWTLLAQLTFITTEIELFFHKNIRRQCCHRVLYLYWYFVSFAAIMIARCYRPPKQFHADHPFIFFLRETKTNAILFAGRIKSFDTN